MTTPDQRRAAPGATDQQQAYEAVDAFGDRFEAAGNVDGVRARRRCVTRRATTRNGPSSSSRRRRRRADGESSRRTAAAAALMRASPSRFSEARRRPRRAGVDHLDEVLLAARRPPRCGGNGAVGDRRRRCPATAVGPRYRDFGRRVTLCVRRARRRADHERGDRRPAPRRRVMRTRTVANRRISISRPRGSSRYPAPRIVCDQAAGPNGSSSLRRRWRM